MTNRYYINFIEIRCIGWDFIEDESTLEEVIRQQTINSLGPGRCGSNFKSVLSTHVTHLPLDKMAANSADDNFGWIFLNENDRILIPISLKFVPKSPIDNESALIQVMAWCRTGDKPLLETMLTQFTDTYMRH